MDRKLIVLGLVLISVGTVLILSGCIEEPVTPPITTPTVTPPPTPTPTQTPTSLSTPTPTPIEYGNFQLLVSDAPADIADFQSLLVTFSSARVFKAGENNSEAGFKVFALNNSHADLTELVGEKALPILNTSLETGNYSKLELYVEEVNAVLMSNETTDVKIPSEKLQIVKPFEIKTNKTTKFVFDINVVKKGHSNEYNLLPVIAKSGVVGEDVSDVEEVETEEEEEEKIEIEVKVKGNVANIRLELNETVSEFTINTTIRDEIIAEIINRTGLTSEQIEQYIEFENEQ